jgi:hypothetical protein
MMRTTLRSVFCLSLLVSLSINAADKPAACADAVYRGFDFWLGDWDTFDTDAPGKPSVARNTITTMLDGCAIREDYRQADGMRGESFTTYDATRQLWHQSWVTNRGELLILEGKQDGRRIVLSGVDRDAKGQRTIEVSWQPQGKEVREIARISRDGGTTWTPMFDIVFRRHTR